MVLSSSSSAQRAASMAASVQKRPLQWLWREVAGQLTRMDSLIISADDSRQSDLGRRKTWRACSKAAVCAARCATVRRVPSSARAIAIAECAKRRAARRWSRGPSWRGNPLPSRETATLRKRSGCQFEKPKAPPGATGGAFFPRVPWDERKRARMSEVAPRLLNVRLTVKKRKAPPKRG
jgi:hypothetical protein